MTTGAGVGRDRRRLAAAAAIVAVHLAVAALLLRPPPRGRFVAVAAAMRVRSVPAPDAPPPVEREVPLDVELAPPALGDAREGDPAPPTCDILGSLRTALTADAGALAALETTAAEPTHAIMAWNGGWSTAPAAAPVRRVVIATLSSAAPDCLDEALVGPRLAFVPVAGSTVTVAFGSGSWSWRAMLPDH